MTTTNISNILKAASASDTQALRARLSGEILLPGETAYDEARKVANLLFDRAPSAIVRVATTEDVAETVRFARTNNVPFAVKSGGHSVAGHSNPEGALLIDMSQFKNVNIDPARQIARVQPGANSGELAGPAHAYGLALSTGDTSSVGIGGLTTGGGIGFMVRKFGLAIDNLLSVEVVTADGQILRAWSRENSDLFWAVRGGGSNFGIITEFEFKLAKVGAVYGGALVLPATKEILRAYIDYATNAPDDLTTITNVMHAPPAPFIPEDRVGEPVLMILMVWSGKLEDGVKAVQPLRELGEVIADAVGPMPYPVIYNFTAEAAQPHYGAIRSLFAREFSDESLEAALEALRNAPSPMSMVQFRPFGGAFNRPGANTTAFAHRDAKLMVTALGLWLDPNENRETYADWVDGLWTKVRHHQSGVYCNFVANEGAERVRDAYPGASYAKLAVVKAKYDPENVFSFNQNIRPAATQSAEKAA